jgi:hypothetical protein
MPGCASTLKIGRATPKFQGRSAESSGTPGGLKAKKTANRNIGDIPEVLLVGRNDLPANLLCLSGENDIDV